MTKGYLFRFWVFCFFAVVLIQPFWAADKKRNTRPKIGLVLGGGGAKGAAEVGVLKYIEKAGIPIDYIAGTSIGSIVGGLYSTGFRSADLDTLFHSQQWLNLLSDRHDSLSSHIYSVRDSVAYVFGFPIKHLKKKAKGSEKHSHKVGLMRGDSIQNLLAKLSGREDSMSFDALPIPFRCVAVDIRQMKEVVFSNGKLPFAMRASMSIPGVFQPLERDSMLLVDGGMLNNLPVDVVRAMGADIVIAIDLTQNKRNEHNDIVTPKAMSPEVKSQFKRMLLWLKERPDLTKYHANVQAADIYINPNLKGYSAADFKPKKIAEMIEQGEKAGQSAMPQLRKLARDLQKYDKKSAKKSTKKRATVRKR
ncbi:MAG: patatin-like phospholipase family protein [Prevotella sp.]|nr:patatin-like phospholipase family protein [Candidatus Equicola faecalis]